jgi:hypothetical protein
MAVIVTRTSIFAAGGDQDGDGRIDPGDTLLTHIRLTNNNGTPITAANFQDSLNGVTIVPGSITVTPIANDDNIGTITGNTPYSFNASVVLANDVDYDDATPTFSIQVGTATHGAVSFDAGTGTFTFTPQTGYVGAASFTYFVTDESGLQSISSGTVNITVQGLVWYVDSNAAAGGDGSYGHAFQGFGSLNAVNGIGDVDGATDTIFVKQNAGGYTTNLVLEAGQTLIGDGHAFSVNSNTISTGAGSTTLTNTTGNVVTLSTDNVVKGFTINSNGAAAVGMVDGASSVSSTAVSQGLVVDETSFTGTGKAIDIDAGGKITATIASLTSSGSSAEGLQLAGTASSGTGLLTGNVTISAGTISGATGQGVVLGQAGGGTASSGGDLNFTYNGAITNPTGSAVEIQDRTGGTVTFGGTISDTTGSANAAILLDQNAGTVNFNGQVTLTQTTGAGVSITNNSATIAFTGAGTGLDITTTSGAGFTATGGGIVTVAGAGNTVSTTTGQIVNIDGVGMNASSINFSTLGASGVVANAHAVYLNNLDNGTFNGGTVTVAGTSGNGAGAQAADGIHIDGGSSATINFAGATIDSTNGDGIDVNGSGNGTVTFTTVDLDNMTGNGVVVTNSNGTVNINGGSIGGSNDPTGDDVNISGGTGSVTVAATLGKTTGNSLVEVSGHSTGSITISGNLSDISNQATAAANSGIYVHNNTGGTITFSGATKTLTTNGNFGVDLDTNTGTTVNFSNGGLAVTTVGNTAFTATGGGTVSVTGSNNTIASQTGMGLNVVSTTIGGSGLTFKSINVGTAAAGPNNAIILNGTGSGGLTVTGTGAANSGGVIQHTAGDAIILTNASNFNITSMKLSDIGTNASGLGVSGTAIFATNLGGVNSITDSTIQNWGVQNTTGGNGLNIDNTNTNMTSMIVTGTLFDGNTANATTAQQADAILMTAQGTSSMGLKVDASIFQHIFDDAVQVTSNLGSTGTLNVKILNSEFKDSTPNTPGAPNPVGGGSGGISLTPFGDVNMFALVDNNTFTAVGESFANTGVIGGTNGSTANADITITNNTIKGVDASRAITFTGDGTSTSKIKIDNNSIDDMNSAHAAIQIDFTNAGTGDVIISNNKLGQNPAAGAGNLYITARNTNAIFVETQSTAQARVSIINNLVSANIGSVFETVRNRAIGTSTQNVTVTGNTITDTNGTHVEYDATAGNTGVGGTIILNISGNTLPGGGAGVIKLNELGVGTLTYTQASTAALSTANSSATVTVQGAPSGNGASPTLPTAPTPPASPLLVNPGFVAETPQDGTGSDPAGGTGGTTGGDGTTVTTDQGGAPDPVLADGGSGSTPGSTSSGPIVDDGVVSQAELNFLVDAAIKRWEAAGASPEQLAAMRAATISIVDMAGTFVGDSAGNTIHLDNDGAGYGWFLDATPGDDVEFGGTGTRLTATGGAAANHIDLLTVIMHELGHQAGLDDLYNVNAAADLMYGYTNPSERRLPADGELNGAVPGTVSHEAFALTPIFTVPNLNAGKIVEVSFQSTVNAFAAGTIAPVVNNSNVAYNDPAAQNAGATETWNTTNSTLLIDSFTIGDVVFKDNNNNHSFDAGEGVVGVKLNLYVDTNANNVLDAGDALVTSVTTGAGGAYAFTGLAAGNYIVQVDPTAFAAAAPLNGLLSVAGGADPDNDVNNDDNGLTAYDGSIASQAITITSGGEPTTDGDADADTNLTLDFGFYQNQAPDAVNDSVSVAEDSGATDLTASLLANDTDPEGDTRTIQSATQGTHGSTSVVAGILTYTPNANYNGSDSFTYTINDGHGGTDTATASVTVTAVNDPVTTNAPATASLNEDATNVAIAGLSISDVDATLAPAGVYEVVLAATHGLLTLTTLTGLTFTGGSDGTADASMTFHGTLADINTALATAKYTPDANYNGGAQISINATDTFGGIVATGTGSFTSDSDIVAVTVNSVNDAPVGADDNGNAIEGVTLVFNAADFSTGFSDPNDNPANAFFGVKITDLPGAAAGVIKLNGVAVSAGDVITKTQLDAGNLTFDPAAGSGGSSPTFHFQVQDDGGVLNGGVDFDQSANLYTLNIAVADAAPALDLDGDDSVTSGTGFDSAYTEGGAAAAISDTDVTITDADAGDDIVSATITITNAETGDKLNVGTLPATVTLDGSSTDTIVKLVAAPGTSAADFEAAIEAITYSSTSDDPTAHGSNVSRSITVTVNDGVLDSNVATAHVAVTDVNDAPSGTNGTITASEDAFRVLTATDFGFSDVDGTLGSVTIGAVSGGKIYFDADGAGGADPVEATLPHTYTAADLASGNLSFKADPDANGSGIGSITFTVTDDDGADAASSNTLTVDVTAVNDTPDIDGVGQPVQATEQTAAAILAGKGVSDVDLDALNGGAGDYAGATFSIARNLSANAEDSFGLVPGASFTVDGSDLKAGGLIFATITTNAGGQLVIAFTSLQTTATSALVDDVIASVNYTNTSDNPPSSVSLAYSFDDGAPGGGQGPGASSVDNQIVSVLIAGVNDAPVNSLGGTIGTGEDAIDAWLSGMSISDPDADPANDLMVVTFNVGNGTLDIRTDVAGGVTAGEVTGDLSGTVSVTATLDEINATLSATNGLTYSPDHDFNGDDTLTVTTNDQGHNGTDPGLTGDGTSEEDVDTRTISVSAVDDPPVAVDDAVATNENAVLAGDVFAANPTTPDSDVDGPALQVAEVEGQAVNVGQTITLASGAKLKLNADGTFSYDPNGKFNYLTHTGNAGDQSGAADLSATDSFTYKLVGGTTTATVTVTVNGVSSADDLLFGTSGDDTIVGTANGDFFRLEQGGNDTVTGLGGGDAFYFGNALGTGDHVDGGGGNDIVAIQGGGYAGGYTLGADNLGGVETLSVLTGSDARFGDTANNLYDYNLITVDANVAAGAQLIVNASSLLAGEDFTFNGSAETDGSFFIYAGAGADHLTGGAKVDIFFFAEGKFGASDTADGGAGSDILVLRGDYTVTFGAGQMTGIETVSFLSAADTRFYSGGTRYDYDITTNNGNVAAGQTVTFNAGGLQFDETFHFNGAAETDGHMRIFGGAGNDVIHGGALDDVIFGGGRGDTLYGGGGNDTFRYQSTTDSNLTEQDGIQDFNLGDKIDLTRIDADTSLAGDQAFSFIGGSAFGNHAGELRAFDQGGGIWLVQGDVDGDGNADFQVAVVVTDNGVHPLTGSDFLL